MAELASPISTGGLGPRFENQVQTGFTVLMLTGGVVPCLEPWPIYKIKLQGRYEGYEVDDFIAFVKDPNSGEEAKLLAQIKLTAPVTENGSEFGKVIQSALKDFRKKDLFRQKRDKIAMITSAQSATDTENVKRVLEFARACAVHSEFFKKMETAHFCDEPKRQKLAAFREQLKKANGGTPVSDEETFLFLRSFYVLGYDLDTESGVSLSLYRSHIALFDVPDVAATWDAVSNEVGLKNAGAGTLTRDKSIRRACFGV